jgi:hypothetical protein
MKILFGKYKGQKVSEIEDVTYLQWVLDNTDVFAALKAEIEQQIDMLKNPDKLLPGKSYITPDMVKKATDYFIQKSHNDSLLADTEEGERARDFFKQYHKMLTGKDYV